MQARNFISKYISIFFGAGLFPKAPGTCGSLVAIIIMYFMELKNIPLLLLNILILIIGTYASHSYALSLKTKDPSEIVIDEVSGVLFLILTVNLAISIMPTISGFASESLIYKNRIIRFALFFILFRIFDIFKFPPISYFDKNLSGGIGIMMDDVVAGIISGITFIVMMILI